MRALPRSLKAAKRRRATLSFPAGAFPAGTVVAAQLTGNPSTLGSGRASVVAGRRTKLTLRLTARARRALSRSRAVRARLTVTAQAPDGTSGKRSRVVRVRR